MTKSLVGISLAIAAACATASTPANLHDLLAQNAGRPLRIVDRGNAHAGKVGTIGSDFFCGIFSSSADGAVTSDGTHAGATGDLTRCYPFTSIKWIATHGPGPDALVIGVAEF